MLLHRSASSPLVALAIASIVLSGCSPSPSPTPTPTAAFASEEEAFAAAEETYRAYIDALNEVDLADSDTFESVFRQTTGEFQVGDRKNLSTMSAERLKLSGENIVTGFVPLNASGSLSTVVARVCVDVSAVSIVDEMGVSQVGPDRPPTYAVDVTFTADAGALYISSASRSKIDTCE